MAFFNYDKPGKGVEKDAPRAKGVFLYFDLLWRKLGRLVLSNLLYFVTSLPVLFVYYMVAFALFGVFLPEGTEAIAHNQAAIIAAITMATLWGTGPVSCGLGYILRSIAREEHAFVTSDFFEQSKKGFWHGLVYLGVDVIVLSISIIAINFYWNVAASGSVMGIAMLTSFVAIIAIYTAMHFYIYQVEITFCGKLLDTYKNSLLLAIATLPMCIFLGIIVVVVSVGFLGNLSPVGIVLCAVIIWMSALRLVPEFYTSRLIKRKFIERG